MRGFARGPKHVDPCGRNLVYLPLVEDAERMVRDPLAAETEVVDVPDLLPRAIYKRGDLGIFAVHTTDLVGFIGKLPGLDPNFAESVIIVQRSKAIRLGDPAVAVSW